MRDLLASAQSFGNSFDAGSAQHLHPAGWNVGGHQAGPAKVAAATV